MPLPQPYRGQPRPKYPRPKKQIRDLKLEKRQKTVIFGIGILIASLLLRFTFSIYRTYHDSLLFAVMGMIFILFLFVLAAVLDGFASINKFRRGYDIDVSGEAEHEADRRTDDSKD